jgi:type IX secretion system PorP/SprF family membrane protein
MKKIYIIILIVFIFALIPERMQAQDPEFSQFYANPLYLNPALSGNKVCPRVALNYRQQWPSVNGLYSTLAASFDRLAYRLGGGIGITAMQDRAAQGTLTTTSIAAVYAPIIPLGKHVRVSMGFQAGYRQRELDWTKLTFGDQIDPRTGFSYVTKENTPQNQATGRFDMAVGALFSTNRFYIGAAADHIFEPNEAFLGGNSSLPRKYTAHAGAIIPIGSDRFHKKFISPNILYRKQQDFQQLNLGLYVKNEAVVGGLWYRGNDAFILLVGLELDNGTKIGYSYDVTVSRLTNATGGAHEVSLGWQFSCKPPVKKYRPDICPSF